MIIDQLTKYLSLPSNPVESGVNKDWGKITNCFGKPLPGDYMKFIDLYGSGEIGGWLTVFNPFSDNPNISLIDQFFAVLSSLNALKEEFPELYPYPLMFEPGGLLPWGISIDRDIYCWRTLGASGRWSVVVIGRHSEPEELSMPMCQFISGHISGSIKSNTIPDFWATTKVEFMPYIT